MEVINGVRIYHNLEDMFHWRDEHLDCDCTTVGKRLYVNGVLIAKTVRR